MAKVTKADLKKYFETGDRPTQIEFENLIDSLAHEDTVSDHSSNTNNPHKVNQIQVGLANVDNTSDQNKPISKATQTGLTALQVEITQAAGAIKQLTNQHIEDKNNPHAVTQQQVGLGQVNNTSDENKPISRATQTSLEGLEATIERAENAVKQLTNQHIEDKNNPHAVTQQQVGLGQVNNTSDENKPISRATQTSLEGLETTIGRAENAVKQLTNQHIEDKNNPHAVTQQQVGLGQVNNTSDENKPISRATQTGLTALQAEITKAENAVKQLTNQHIEDKNNPHAVTQQQVGLGQVNNTSDENKPISRATQTGLAALQTEIVNLATELKKGEETVKQLYNKHTEDKNNPHAVTQQQVGLDQVNNTSDENKPISKATQTSLAALQAEMASLAKVVAVSSTSNEIQTSDQSTVSSTENFEIILKDADLLFDDTKPLTTLIPAKANHIIDINRITIIGNVTKAVEQEYANVFIAYNKTGFNKELIEVKTVIGKQFTSKTTDWDLDYDLSNESQTPVNAAIVIKGQDGIGTSGIEGQAKIKIEYSYIDIAL